MEYLVKKGDKWLASRGKLTSNKNFAGVYSKDDAQKHAKTISGECVKYSDIFSKNEFLGND